MDQYINYLQDHFARSANNVEYPEATYKSASLLIPQFNRLLKKLTNHQLLTRKVIEFETKHSKYLLEKLEQSGSDKGNRHHYHIFYSYIFEKLGINNKLRILEVGLGTNNPKLLSTMGIGGTPGASLRAFRDFLPNANIYGADIDRDILFEEERIKTSFVDQLNAESFEELGFDTESFDLIIDDGLHSIGANFNTLLYALDHVSDGGWIVIEDIHSSSNRFWEVIDFFLHSQTNFESAMIQCRKSLIYAVHKPVSQLRPLNEKTLNKR